MHCAKAVKLSMKRCIAVPSRFEQVEDQTDALSRGYMRVWWRKVKMEFTSPILSNLIKMVISKLHNVSTWANTPWATHYVSQEWNRRKGTRERLNLAKSQPHFLAKVLRDHDLAQCGRTGSEWVLSLWWDCFIIRETCKIIPVYKDTTIKETTEANAASTMNVIN